MRFRSLSLLAATGAITFFMLDCATTDAGDQAASMPANTVTSPMVVQNEAPPATEPAASASDGGVVQPDAEAQVDPALAPIVLEGERFSIHVPTGFREVEADEEIARNGLMQSAFNSGGMVLLQRSAEKGAERRGVIVARGPSKAKNVGIDLIACQQMADRMAMRASATQPAPAALMALPVGEACGFSLIDPDGIAIDNLFLTVDGKTWGLQALHDASEVATPQGFQEVASSWKISAEQRARGTGFSIPVLTGFVLPDEENNQKAVKEGAALILALAPPPFSEARRGYIWVQRIEGGPGVWSRLSACRELATTMLASRSKTSAAERVDVVHFPFGDTCRVQIADSADPLGRVITIPVYRASEVFVVTCSLDVRDEETRAACQRVAEELLLDS